MKQKVFFINFKGLLVAKNCLRPKNAPLNVWLSTEYTSEYCQNFKNFVQNMSVE